jgi:hypothetical protein
VFKGYIYTLAVMNPSLIIAATYEGELGLLKENNN